MKMSIDGFLSENDKKIMKIDGKFEIKICKKITNKISHSNEAKNFIEKLF